MTRNGALLPSAIPAELAHCRLNRKVSAQCGRRGVRPRTSDLGPREGDLGRGADCDVTRVPIAGHSSGRTQELPSDVRGPKPEARGPLTERIGGSGHRGCDRRVSSANAAVAALSAPVNVSAIPRLWNALALRGDSATARDSTSAASA